MSNLPRRYQFDRPDLPAYQPAPLPEQRQDQAPTVIHQHVHMAPPDRTLTKLALGAGIGAGGVTAGVIFLPLLIQAVHALVASLMALAFFAAVICWAVVQIVQAIGSTKGQQAAKTVRKGWRRHG